MIDSYWDLYVAYIAKCVKENKEQDIDPHHYEMEWNHWLPKACFPDLPLGQWLTKKQHSIASSLQTLALKKKCMCAWHREDLPPLLVEKSWPLYCLSLSETQRGEMNHRYGKSCSEEDKRKKSEAMIGRRWFVSIKGETVMAYDSPGPEWQQKRGPEREETRRRKSESHRGEIWFVNEKGETTRAHESPGPEWQNGRKWKPQQ
jgi:hypothetical protein